MTDQYIGIDLHKAFFQACAVTATGERIWEERFPRTPAGIAALTARCTATTAVAVEASTPTWHFADAVTASVGDLRVVDPWKTKLKAGYAAKTDRLDARRLADALRRDSVVGIYYPPLAIRELRELCRARHALVQTRTALVNRVRALLLRQGLAEARRLAKSADDRWLETLPLPPRAAASVRTLRGVLAVVRTEIARAEERDRPRGRGGAPPQCDGPGRAGTAGAARHRAGAGADHSRRDRYDCALSNRRTPRQFRGPGPACGGQCRAGAVWPHHQAGLAVVTLGADRSRDARHDADRSRRPLGTRLGDAERRAQSASRAGPRAV